MVMTRHNFVRSCPVHKQQLHGIMQNISLLIAPKMPCIVCSLLWACQALYVRPSSAHLRADPADCCTLYTVLLRCIFRNICQMLLYKRELAGFLTMYAKIWTAIYKIWRILYRAFWLSSAKASLLSSRESAMHRSKVQHISRYLVQCKTFTSMIIHRAGAEEYQVALPK